MEWLHRERLPQSRSCSLPEYEVCEILESPRAQSVSCIAPIPEGVEGPRNRTPSDHSGSLGRPESRKPPDSRYFSRSRSQSHCGSRSRSRFRSSRSRTPSWSQSYRQSQSRSPTESLRSHRVQARPSPHQGTPENSILEDWVGQVWSSTARNPSPPPRSRVYFSSDSEPQLKKKHRRLFKVNPISTTSPEGASTRPNTKSPSADFQTTTATNASVTKKFQQQKLDIKKALRATIGLELRIKELQTKKDNALVDPTAPSCSTSIVTRPKRKSKNTTRSSQHLSRSFRRWIEENPRYYESSDSDEIVRDEGSRRTEVGYEGEANTSLGAAPILDPRLRCRSLHMHD
ncbi:hypothetical protein QAD02_012799 [Eretmocerus hayati]|uniref:Uncharacterized protein n=1 Tax=Eretmocerus hayati TaxID=131215 RepID=A0ACC2P0W9_9HYME|nr:hypothetical protein QAD02_012799 [Eretmocerus hayati]